MSSYLPILAVERSQLAGLAATTDAVKGGLTPLFDVLPLGAPPIGGAPSVTAQLEEVIAAIGRAWDASRPALLDCRTGYGNERLADGRVHVAWLLDEARTRGIRLAPVTGLRRTASYQLAVADAAQADGHGVCLRLELPDFHELATLESRVEAVVEQLAIAPEWLDLVIDLGPIAHAQVPLLEVTARAVLAPLVRAEAWRSVTLAASALPARDERVPAPPLNGRPPRTIARTEWLLWRALTRAMSPLDRPLRFGDYGAQLAAEAGRAIRNGCDRVYYTHDAEWLVLDPSPRDGEGAHGGRSAVPGLGRLTARPEFHGAAHCAGDACFADCAPNGASGLDPATVWRAAATTHHLTTVVEQLESI